MEYLISEQKFQAIQQQLDVLAEHTDAEVRATAMKLNGVMVSLKPAPVIRPKQKTLFSTHPPRNRFMVERFNLAG